MQETWCVDAEPDSFYHIAGCSLERLQLQLQAGDDLEAIWLKVTAEDIPKPIIIASIYRPPSTALDPLLSNLECCLRQINRVHETYFTVLTGDFNARNSYWYTEDTTDDAGDYLHQLISLFSLEQLNHFPTNIYADQLESCQDLVSTDIPSAYTWSTNPLGNSDHVVIAGSVETSPQPFVETRREVWCWSKVNQQELRNAVTSANWTDVLDTEDGTLAWQIWKTRLLDIADQHVPKRFVPTNSPRQRPWMNATLQLAIREKHRLFRAYKRNPSLQA